MSHLLVVDDDDLVRSALSLVLETFGHSVTAVGSTREVVDVIADGTEPDVILADYRLRNGDTGVDAIVTAWALLGARVPALILTGETAPERLAELRHCGVPMLHKPVHGDALADSIDHLLHARRAVPVDGGATDRRLTF